MKIVLTGGGTGGHIYPGLTLWHHIRDKHPDAQVLYIGSENGLEKNIVEHEAIPFRAIRAAGLRRQVSLRALKTVAVTYMGYMQAKRALRKFKPDIVVGTGGYVTLPVVFAAAKLKIPCVVWEANARPGLTNQLCSKKANAVAVSFPDTEKWFRSAKKVVLTGNPRASEVLNVSDEEQSAARAQYRFDSNQKLIVCFAGSRGAETINEVVVKLIPRFVEKPHWKFLYVTGDKHFEHIAKSIGSLPKNVELLPFIHDMPSVLPQASVVITRAGGATLAEICSLGLCSILIPSPYVTANHQEENAKRLVSHGAAKMLKESELTSEKLWREIESLQGTEEGDRIRAKARELGTPQAVENLYQLVMDALAD